MRVTLTVTAGPHLGQSFTFTGHDLFLVGRSKSAHFRLPAKDRYFSRIHFLVEVNPPLCRIQDMGSRNGTHVNGARVTRADLHDGDEIKAGHTVLRVGLGAAGAKAAPPPDERAGPTAAEQTIDFPSGTLAPPTLPPPTAEPAATDRTLPQPGLPAAAAPPNVPGYRLVRLLGRGGMGVVFLAERLADGAAVAVKAVAPSITGDDAQVRRFLREAEVLKQLDHPGIVRFFEVGESEGLLFFAMEYVPGVDLGRVLRERGPLPVRLAVRIVRQVLEALAHAHARRFVHRDIKPSNVLLADVGGRRRVKLADFGLARVYQASKLSGLTLTGDWGGTPAYLPPEQVTHYRDVSPAADQYSTAAMLYHLLTGQYALDLPPLPGALIAILEDEPVPIRSRRPDLPERLAAAVHRALAKRPEDRFPDVAAFRAALWPYA